MSVLVVDYGAINDLNSTATRLARVFQSRINDYEGIVNKVNSLPTSRGNLENANYFIKKKNEQYQTKINKLNLFKTKMVNFSEQAQATDKRVASRITSETNIFKKKNGISVNSIVALGSMLNGIGISWTKLPFAGAISSACKTVRDIKDVVKDWYKTNGKFVIKMVLTGVVCIAAVIALVLATGPLAILAAAVILFNAASSFYYSIKANNSYSSDGNRNVANRIGEKGGSDMAKNMGGSSAAFVLGEKYRAGGEKIFGFVHGGLTLFASIYSLGQIFTGLKDFSVGKDFKVKTFVSAFKTNRSSATPLPLKQVISNNVTGQSMFKSIEDYGTVRTLVAGSSKVQAAKAVFKSNYMAGTGLLGGIKNIAAPGTFANNLNKNTIGLPGRIKDKVLESFSNGEKFKDSFSGSETESKYNMPEINIHRNALRIATIG